MGFLADDGGLDAKRWHSQRRQSDVSVQFVLPRRLEGEAGEEAAGGKQQERWTAGGRAHSLPPSSRGPVPTVNACSSCRRPPLWVSFTCPLLQPQTWPEPVLHLGKAFFNLDNLSNLNINLAVMTMGFWSCPGRT